MSDTPSLALPLIAAGQAQKHVTHNEALAVLDSVVQLAVKDRSLSAPPASPSEGDRYIAAAGASGAWSGHATEIAALQGGAWSFRVPREGWIAWVEDENALLIFDGAAWVDVGSAIKVLQNLTLLGVGTAADATNPFSAKLNKALWTAKTIAEGGDGDLRYTMSKEAAADVLSLLFQTGFSGRLEIGLIGDDDLTVKVSPDGSAWIEALRIDKGSGAVLLNGALTIDLSAGALPAPPVNTALHLKGLVDSPTRLFIDTMGNDAGDAPNVAYRWARNSGGDPAAAQSGDILGLFSWFGYGATGYSASSRAQLRGVAAETWTDSAQGTRLVFLTSANGAASAQERFAVENDGALTLGGVANTVVDADRNFRRRSYTIATLPASVAGKEVWCSDLGGGAGPLIGDGTGWLHDGQGGQTTSSADAGATVTALTNAPRRLYTGTLTANRTIALSTTNARPGSWFLITRTGAGAFNLDIGGLKNLVQNTWCKVVFDGAAWYLAAYGTL